MLCNFRGADIATEGSVSFARWSGTGPPVLLHGFPQTHAMWHAVAPLLAQRFTVVCADLRGYGRSGCPPSRPDHAPYAKRAMAADMVGAMRRLGFERFAVVGHDRGARVAYRMALDHPQRISALAVLDVVPIEEAWRRADARLAQEFWPWSLLAQPQPLPERLLLGAPQAVRDNALGGWGTNVVLVPIRDARYCTRLWSSTAAALSRRAEAPLPTTTLRAVSSRATYEELS